MRLPSPFPTCYVPHVSSHTTSQVKLGGLACQLLGYLADPGITQAQVMAEMLHEGDPEFDARLVQAAASTEGGRPLRGEVGTRLSLALEVKKWKAHATQMEAALKTGGGAEAAENPFRGLEGKVDAEALEEAYGTALEDLVHQQVGSASTLGELPPPTKTRGPISFQHWDATLRLVAEIVAIYGSK